MIFRNFTIQVILHLAVITAMACFSTYFFIYKSPEISLFCSAILIADACVLISSFNRTNRNLAYFFESVVNDDTQIKLFSKTKNKSIQRLYESMNYVNEVIARTKALSQRNEQYYKALIQQSATGLIVMTGENNIEIANDKACELTGILVPVNFKRLETKNPELWSLLCKIKPGETAVFKVLREGLYLHLLIRATGLRYHQNEIKLISVQDINQELEAKETESWQKLISILTHEIMNSIAPITSLTSTLTKFYKKDDKPIFVHDVNDKVIADTIQGLEIIGERGNGLLNFVTSYRRLTKIPNPVFNHFSTFDWLTSIKILLFGRLEANQIVLDINIHKSIKTIYGDDKLLTQVIINLIYNAIDALLEKVGNRHIIISIDRNEQHQTQITVANNGCMIPLEIQDKIFIPFFTTRESGSGIGLSLSKQIVQLHHGYLFMESDIEITKFVIVL